MATETLRPNATGDEENIAGENPAVDHYLNVDEAVADDGTTFIYTSAVSYERDFYNFANSGVGAGTINKVTVHFSGGGAVTPNQVWLKLVVKSGSTVEESAEKTPGAGWGNLESADFTTDPDTSSAWTWAAIDSIQAGISIKRCHTAGNTSYATQVYIVVDYTPVTFQPWAIVI